MMPRMEWTICQDDQEWEVARQSAPPAGAALPLRRTGRAARRWVMIAALVLALPALIVGRVHLYQADQTMDHVEAEVVAAVTSAPADPGAEGVQNPGPEVRDVKVRSVEVRSTYAMVEVWTMVSDQPWMPTPYRQTRFYQETVTGWQPSIPPDLFWQPLDTLQVGRFTFAYGARDAYAVLIAARQVESLDTDIRTILGLPPTDEALTIRVDKNIWLDLSPEHLAHLSTGVDLYAPSPALLPLPANISEGDALLQLTAGLLVQHSLDEAMRESDQGCVWQPVVDGLRAWLLWEYNNLPSVDRYNTARLLRHQLSYDILPRLNTIRLDQAMCAIETNPPSPMSTFSNGAAATAFVDYAVAVYGRARLPALVAIMRHAVTWEELIPTVFGVSAAEFEAGWQEYLLNRSAS